MTPPSGIGLEMKPANNHLPKIVLFARDIGEYSEMLTNAALLAPMYQIVMVTGFPYDSSEKLALIKRAEDAGYKCYDICPQTLQLIKNKAPKPIWKRIARGAYKMSVSIIKWLKRKIAVGLRTLGRASVSIIKGLKRKIANTYRLWKRSFFSPYSLAKLKARAFAHIIENEKPSAFITNSVNGATFTEIYVKECRKRNIPTVIVPFTYVSPVAPAHVHSDNPEYVVDGTLKAVMAIFFKRWLYDHNGRTMTRLPFGRVLVQRLLGIETPLPWIQDSSSVDFISAESEYLRGHYVRLGIPPEKIQLIGKPNLDHLAAMAANRDDLRSTILRELQMDAGRPVILVAMPPALAVFDKPQYSSEFASYEEIVSFWTESIAALKEFNVIICLHPKLKISEESMTLFAKHVRDPVKVSLRNTGELLAISDLYIAGGSGTILWALALGVPVIDHDIYGMNFDFFEGNDDVVTIKTKAAFVAELTRLAEDKEYLVSRKKRLDVKKERYGLLDGKSVSRLQELIKKVAHTKAA